MLLNLDEHSILVIENNPIKNDPISLKDVQIGFENNQHSVNIKSVYGRSKEVKKGPEFNQNSLKGNKNTLSENQSLEENTRPKAYRLNANNANNLNGNLNRSFTKNETQNRNQYNIGMIKSSSENEESKQSIINFRNNSNN